MERRKKIYLGTNTKMYKTTEQTVTFLERLNELTQDISRDRMELFVIPSYITLPAARASVPQESVLIGAQNMGWEEEGQFTGEISPLMLREAGVNIVMAGHSERRHIFRETDEEENKKVLCALQHGFKPLLCVGETAGEKDFGIAEEVLRMQLKVGFHNVTPEQAKAVSVAYEPVWAIGVNGVPATKEYADHIHKVIRDTLVELFGAEVGGDIPVLYGGSVNPQNAEGLIGMPYIDGLFIGRSAWDADNFHSIIRMVLPLFEEKRRKEAAL
ncbi:triose-phosphate isomerase [Caproiciproducens galactitolivorans]|uniref:triose-phosphate isomerase n=1 Tax=Caproiciproducens galactitolivorans TaxID=642589 RepID=UPI0024094751|nr:triose-phosphate isomerase [Caproiciproducens galactitolivorans]